ncbi:Transporter associated domain protein [compost metagenome]
MDSIGGWLFKELEGNPSKGKRIVVGDVTFEVEESTRLRITRINIHRETPPAAEASESGDEDSE